MVKSGDQYVDIVVVLHWLEELKAKKVGKLGQLWGSGGRGLIGASAGADA